MPHTNDLNGFKKQDAITFTTDAMERVNAYLSSEEAVGEVICLVYFLRMTDENSDGQISIVKEKGFVWGSYNEADVPDPAIKNLLGKKFAVLLNIGKSGDKVIIDHGDDGFFMN